MVNSNRLSEILENIRSIAEEVADMQIDLLHEALLSGETSGGALEKKLGTLRRSLAKSQDVLQGLLSSAE